MIKVATIITRLEGGAGLLALRGAAALDPASFRVTLIAGSGGGLIEEAARAGLEVVLEPSLRRAIDPRADVPALRALTALLADRSVDVAHTHTAKAGALGRLAGHRAGVPRIVHTYHGFPFHEFQSAARRTAYVAVERRLGRITDVALCTGAGVAAEAVRRRLIAPERVMTIGVVVPVADGYAPPDGARERARKDLGIDQDTEVIGAVGRLTYQKAPEQFIAAVRQAARRRPSITGVWIGGGELTAKMERLAARGGTGGERILLAGERSDVLGLLPAFDVFVLPSRYEGLPTAVAEAMVCGVPVVATAVNAVSDLVIPGQTGLLVPPERPDLLADAACYLLGSPRAAAAMAAAARARIAGRFGTPALRDALNSAYTGEMADYVQ
jgi:glycosyltransferase involved in cell wall biosynthesis